jgi:hypothetical protein
MLKKENSLFIYLLLILFVCCKQQTKTNFLYDDVKEYQRIHFDKYKSIYTACNDSIKDWIKDSLEVVKSPFFNPYQLDSTLCFNSDSNRFFTTINKSLVGFKNSSPMLAHACRVCHLQVVNEMECKQAKCKDV